MRLLLISGSLRDASTNSAALGTVAARMGDDIQAELYEEMGSLPHFNPDDDVEHAPPAAVARLRARIAAADAVLLCTPEYAGALPGAFKNLLEWTVGGIEMYGRPVAWINVSGPAAPTGGADAHASLATVLGYIGADVVEAACVRVPISRQSVGADGLVHDASAESALDDAVSTLTQHVRQRDG